MKPQPTKNQQILLGSRPSGEPTLDNFQLTETEIPKPGPGQMLLRTIYLSLDPYMRGRMNAGPSYAPPVEIGKVMSGQSVCEVVESNLLPQDTRYPQSRRLRFRLRHQPRAVCARRYLGRRTRRTNELLYEALRDQVETGNIA